MDPPSGAAIVRFRTVRDGDVVGHGVLVDDEHVVTCAHVVNVALGRPQRSELSALGEVLRIEFPLLAQLTALPPERRARVDAWAPPGGAFDGVDVAGLTLVGEQRPVGAIPVPLSDEPAAAGDVLMFGPVEGRPGGWVSASLRPIVKQYRQQIDQRAQGSHAAQPGYSGTPIVDTHAGQVLGILVATPVGRGDVGVYAVPVPGLVAAWPEVFAPMPPSPYKGLAAFGPDDGHLFFGRARMTRELAAAVDARGLVPVVGASGVGKSSLVHAGLIPWLTASATPWTFVSVRPRPDLESALSAGFARRLVGTRPVPVADLEAWQERIRSGGVAGAARLLLGATGAERLLLVIDQFEEAVDGSPSCAGLTAQLGELAEQSASPLVAVLTLREDTFGRLFVQQREFGELLRRTAVALRGMDENELRAAIVEPAELQGLTVHEPLVRELAGSVAGHPGALPLLEFTLDRMWGTLRRGQGVLSFEAYEEIGRLDGALAEWADGALAALSQDERPVVRRLFLHHLIAQDRSDVRRVALRSELVPAEWAIAVRLANERLLTISRSEDGEETVEVVHEALLRSWSTLTSWLEKEQPFRHWRQLLAYAMRDRGAGEERSAVLTGPLLADSERWLAERPTDVNVEERRFITESRERQDREERQYRTLFQESLSRTLSVAAQGAQDTRLALLFAVEALERCAGPEADALVRSCLRGAGASEMEVVREPAEGDAVHRIGNRLRLRQWVHGPDTPEDRWMLGGGETFVVIDRDGRAAVRWALSEGRDEIELPGPAVLAACTDDTDALCLGTEHGELFMYQVTSRAEEMWRIRLPAPATCVAVDGPGSRLAVACDDGVVRVLSAQQGGSEVFALPSPGYVTDLDFSPDCLDLASAVAGRSARSADGEQNGEITLWDLRSGERRSVPGGRLGTIAFTQDGHHLVTGPWRQDGVLVHGRLPLGTDSLTRWARQVAGPSLTDEEWMEHIGALPDDR
ncbi:trypsin-like peptidase domain-containing protein [Streptomyces atriruber]|uniref:nSTAND1 domain-containing NTPase n=1 Tax=Streptomyces atriruber TaxID=545121 RepID=UPI000A7BC0A1|nr:trypsin-like peptidase domain-containing protein [Streptomyces atriruber]